MLSDFIRQTFGNTTLQALSFAYYTYPIWLPISLCIIFWDMWVHYVRNAFFSSIKYTLLEIRLPIEIHKSPAAMEVVLDSFWQIGGETTFVDRYWDGKTRPYYALELVSIEGNIKFYIWTRESEKDIIESRIYSQYPGVEIYDVPDYAKGVVLDKSKKMCGCLFKLVNSKTNALPIKTYVDFGLSENPKEEHKVEPMAPLLEFLGSLGPGEQAWYQIVIHTHKNAEDRLRPNKWFKIGFDFEKSMIGFYIDSKGSSIWEKTDWKEEGDKEIKKIRDSLYDKDDPKHLKFPRIMTKGEGERIATIERTMAKPAFNTGIRAIYIADADKYIGGRKNSLYGGFRHFNSVYNGLKPTKFTSYDNIWEDFFGIGEQAKKVDMLSAYKKRGFFFAPYKEKEQFVMNAEELATLYHFPGSVATTPTLTRIPSKKSEAPSNLPV